ncbi:MAG: D-tyrosyl-tRNA(Tyr) deacylase [Verrucomicrobia bacterium]|jgi:D-aminoacyl-tRNA deacylase|nr:D-tyrosyl-tRNA(Tyr) deacylase [Verrucomicrobiota bacterium]
MRLIVQRVSRASVTIEGKVTASIGTGLLVLVAFEADDNESDIEWTSGKLIRLRVFSDAGGLMNLSVQDVGGEVLLVSQFTLYASTRKGNRPSYLRSARPEIAIPLYESFVRRVTQDLGKPVGTGQFGAEMRVELVNEGPVTLSIDSRTKE